MIKQVKVFTAFFILILSFASYAHDNNFIDNLSIKNGQQFTEKFIVGGQPSESDLVILSKNGIKTVINLRGNGEFNDFDEKTKVEALGMQYVAIPISGAAGINHENLAIFTTAIAKKEKAFVHCASGNRVGAMFALDAHINNDKNVEEAILVGKKAGLTRLESTVRKVMMTK